MHNKSLIKLSHIVYPKPSSMGNQSRLLSPRKSSKIWRRRSKFVLRSSIHYRYLRELQTSIKPQLMARLFKLHPGFYEKIYRAYAYRGNRASNRTKLLIEHYHFIADCLPEATAQAIYGTSDGLEISRFTVGEAEYHFTLCYFQPNGREGDLSIKLLDQNNNIFYCITFNISGNENIGHTITVGGLQGPKSTEETKEKIKYFTKKHHGLRPKDLMVRVLIIIANVWNVKQLLLVNSNSHVSQSKRFRISKIKTDYNRHWESLNASRYNKNLYALSLVEVRKAPEDVKRSKRAMYRKRYQWLDELTEEISQKLSLLASFED